MCTCINEFKKGYQPRTYAIKKHDSTIIAVTNSILSRWKQFFINLLNFNLITNHDGREIFTVEPVIPEPSLIEIEPICYRELKKHKAPKVDHISSELIQAGGGKLYDEMHKLIVLNWSKEGLPQE